MIWRVTWNSISLCFMTQIYIVVSFKFSSKPRLARFSTTQARTRRTRTLWSMRITSWSKRSSDLRKGHQQLYKRTCVLLTNSNNPTRKKSRIMLHMSAICEFSTLCRLIRLQRNDRLPNISLQMNWTLRLLCWAVRTRNTGKTSKPWLCLMLRSFGNLTRNIGKTLSRPTNHTPRRSVFSMQSTGKKSKLWLRLMPKLCNWLTLSTSKISSIRVLHTLKLFVFLTLSLGRN